MYFWIFPHYRINALNMSYTPEDGFPYYLEFVRHMDCSTLYSSETTLTFLSSINEEKALFQYAPDKWSIKQVLGHITDHERIKIFRAFLLSRKQEVELWGYDQNMLVDNSRFDEIPFQELLSDYKNVRKASASFVASLSENQLRLEGKARQFEVTLEDFLRTIIGHEVHHINIIKERYLI